jgi:dephospho-CoA kinase
LDQLAAWRFTFVKHASSASAPSEARAGERRRRFFCVVIPLLFETHAEKEVDTILCIACSAATQRERLGARGWTPQQIEQRINSQLPIEEKMARADQVIWNEGPVEILGAQLGRVLQRFP